MSWFALSGNEGVSFNDLQSAVDFGVFVATGTPIPASDELVTKSDAPTYVVIDTSYSSYAALSFNEEVTKDDLVSGAVMRTIYWNYYKFGFYSGSMEIYKGFTKVVDTTIDGFSGSFNAADGETLTIYVYTDAAYSYSYIQVDGPYVAQEWGPGFIVASYNFDVSADHSITGTSMDNS